MPNNSNTSIEELIDTLRYLLIRLKEMAVADLAIVAANENMTPDQIPMRSIELVEYEITPVMATLIDRNQLTRLGEPDIEPIQAEAFAAFEALVDAVDKVYARALPELVNASQLSDEEEKEGNALVESYIALSEKLMYEAKRQREESLSGKQDLSHAGASLLLTMTSMIGSLREKILAKPAWGMKLVTHPAYATLKQDAEDLAAFFNAVGNAMLPEEADQTLPFSEILTAKNGDTIDVNGTEMEFVQGHGTECWLQTSKINGEETHDYPWFHVRDVETANAVFETRGELVRVLRNNSFTVD